MPIIILIVVGVVAFMLVAVHARADENSLSADDQEYPADQTNVTAPEPRFHHDETKVKAPEPRFRAAAFLSPAERSFFGVLRQAVENDYHIFAKVRLADIITPEKTNSRSASQVARNKISCKHVDFLLCETGDLSPVAAIELDDKSHSTLAAGFRDEFVDAALRGAQIPTIRFAARRAYAPAEIKSQLQALINNRCETAMK